MTSLRTTNRLTSWGGVLRARHAVTRPRWSDQLGEALGLVAAHPNRGLPVGLSRSYGDSGLNPGGAVLDMAGLDRLHAFDHDRGVVRADAGLSLDALIGLAAPHGWFPPVVPGTRFVTLGGAIANDIHGKNHHQAGTFGRHVRRIGLMRSNGDYCELSPDDCAPLFAATVGGLGLTGLIAWAEIQLSPVAGAWLEAEDVAFQSVDGFFDLAAESAERYAHTVAWLDCLTPGRGRRGRGIFTRANPSPDPDRRPHRAPRLNVPLDMPCWALNPLSMRVFNEAYFRLKRARSGVRKAHYDAMFFPLDGVRHWNRIYGRLGFFQYQCVVPAPVARAAVNELVDQIVASGQASFLGVLKTFGGLPSPGMLSFPMEGATLALDFPNRGEETLRLLQRLDDVVREAGGRLYPAKDARMSTAMFADGYPRLAEFVEHIDPNLTSAFWRRVAA